MLLLDYSDCIVHANFQDDSNGFQIDCRYNLDLPRLSTQSFSNIEQVVQEKMKIFFQDGRLSPDFTIIINLDL